MISAFLLTSLQSSMFPGLSLDAQVACYDQQTDGSWKYLEYVFIVQPTNKINAISNNAVAAIATTSSLFLAYNWANTPTAGSQSFNLMPHLAATGLTKVLYDAYCARANSEIKAGTMKSFLANWNAHREYVPKDFAIAFDELANIYNTNPENLSDKTINEMFEIITHLIEHSFSKRYEKEKTKGFDLLNAIKTTTDIGKNLGGK